MGMVEARKCSVVHVPDLASDVHLNELKNNIFTFVDSQGSGVPPSVLRPLGLPREKLHPQIRERIKSAVGLKLSILASEVKLGMNQERDHIVIKIQDSNIASLNLGSVIGNISASINTVAKEDKAIAEAIKELVESVSKAGELERTPKREVVEALEQIAQQASLPKAERRQGVVKPLMAHISSTLSGVANLATIWDKFGPAIASFFEIT